MIIRFLELSYDMKNELKNFIPDDPQIECICTNLQFTEGPVWDKRNNRLLFSEIQFNTEHPREFDSNLKGNRIMSWSNEEGLQIFYEPSGNSNGLTFDDEGNLIVCEMENRCISSITPDKKRRVLVDAYNGRRFNAPNDIVVRNDGDIYFSDPEYGIYIGNREIPQQGLYKFNPSKKRIDLLIEDFVQPNGLAFSPDYNRLYVVDSARAFYHINYLDIDRKGNITESGIIAKVPGADGMKVDNHGNLYIACREGVCILSSSGENIGTINVPERPANLAWGDKDLKSLYLTAKTSIYKIRLLIEGLTTF